MNILLIDDEELILESEETVIRKALPDARLFTATNYKEACDIAEGFKIDIVYSDVEMPGMTGIELAKRIKSVNPQVNIVFVTAYREYALEAHEIYASGYLLKPITVDMVKETLHNLRYPVQPSIRGFWVQCFGKFEVYYQDQPVRFKRSKAKEVFAYLVDLKGATANTAELVAALWEDSPEIRKNHKHLWTLIGELKRVLKDCDAEDVLIHQKNCYSIDTSKMICDYYQYLNGDLGAINSYHGEYMSQYSWSEMTQGWLKWNK